MITLQDIFAASYVDDGEPDNVTTKMVYTGIRPRFIEKLERTASRCRSRSSARPARRSTCFAATRARREDAGGRRDRTPPSPARWCCVTASLAGRRPRRLADRRRTLHRPRHAAGPTTCACWSRRRARSRPMDVGACWAAHWPTSRSVDPPGRTSARPRVRRGHVGEHGGPADRGGRRRPPTRLLDAVGSGDQVGLVTFSNTCAWCSLR